MVTRASGASTWDESTGRETPTAPVAVYVGPARVQVPNVQPATPTAGEFVWTVLSVALQLPMSAPLLERGDVVTVMAAGQDVELVGRVYRVRAMLPAKTHATHRTAACEEVQG